MNVEVVIIGGGLVGFMLVFEFVMVGVKICVIECFEKFVLYFKVLILYFWMLEFFEMRGLLECFVFKGSKIFFGYFLMLDICFDFLGLDMSCFYMFLFLQVKIEQLFEEYV